MTSLAVARVAITRWQGKAEHLHEDRDELAMLVERRAALPRVEPLLELGLGRGLGGLGGLGLG